MSTVREFKQLRFCVYRGEIGVIGVAFNERLIPIGLELNSAGIPNLKNLNPFVTNLLDRLQSIWDEYCFAEAKAVSAYELRLRHSPAGGFVGLTIDALRTLLVSLCKEYAEVCLETKEDGDLRPRSQQPTRSQDD